MENKTLNNNSIPKKNQLPKTSIKQTSESQNEPAVICPNCRQIVSSQHFKCPYCRYCLGCDNL